LEIRIPSKVIVAAIHVGGGTGTADVERWYRRNKDKELVAYARGYYRQETKNNSWLVLEAHVDGTYHYINLINTSFEPPFNIKKRIGSGELGSLIPFGERVVIPVSAYMESKEKK